MRISICYRHSFVLLLAALVLALGLRASGGLSAQTAPPRATGIGLIKWGGGSGASNNWNVLTHTDKYGVVTVGPANARRAGRLPGRGLLYGCGGTVPDADWSGECGVPWAAAVANDWLLKAADGSYVGYPGYDYLYLADIGNPAYQKAWIAAMDSALRRYPGIKGVWIDNVVGDLIAPSVEYPDSASYRAAMLSFISAVGPALRAKGWYVAAESIMVDTTTPGWRTTYGDECDGSQDLWWYRQIAPEVDGIATEYWQMSRTDGEVRLAGSASCNGQNWGGWQRIVSAVQGMRKDFIPLTSGPADSAGVAKSTYLKASFLLEYDGGPSAFIYAPGGNGNYDAKVDDWMAGAPWTFDLGKPTGSKRKVGVGWRREFSGGTVVIDPNPTKSQRFALRGTYLLPGGASVNSVTLVPGTALILRRRSRRH
jgi:Hypothetical glycosyl hydrolase family 15